MAIPPDFREAEPGDGDLDPPDAARVARRACCLAAVALRGLACTWAEADQREMVPELAGWFDQAGLEGEVEPGELELIRTPAGALEGQAVVDAVWRWEGAAVLAASLGRLALPPHDQVVDTQACGQACGVFAPRGRIDELVRSAAFDEGFDRFAYADRAVAVHWRLRQYVHAGPAALDFAKYARGVEWATFDLRGVRLVEGDLAIGERPVFRAAPEEVSRVMSIAAERHIAANWLVGWGEVYSEVENPT